MQDNIIFKILLFPISLLYMAGLSLRNMCYDVGLLKSASFNLPVISIGNLVIGGAGKTPHVEYLVRLLDPFLHVGVLSRGYKRKTKGFRIVNAQDSAELSGDEPKQYAMKFPEIRVAVSESRATGIPDMLKIDSGLQVILLDDAFQHRAVTPYLNLLLTAYDRLYPDDYLLPSGRLREYASAADRADMIIVTKCPHDMTEENRQEILSKLKAEENQSVFFSYYRYYSPYRMYQPQHRINLTEETEVVLLAAIANTQYLEDYLDETCTLINTIKFEDHHYFTDLDIQRLVTMFKQEDQKDMIILTTEKDATRLHLHQRTIIENQLPIYILPLEVAFHFGEKDKFDSKIKDLLLEFKS